jgi:tRNA-Thr(GGU) m(6)t(6)A37 methyltransferase TsaA
MNPDTTEPEALTLHPIGVMRTGHLEKVDAPRQPAAATDVPGIIELRADLNLQHALDDLGDWQRIWVIFWFDRNTGWRPKVLPPRSTTGRKGVLATRSPHRPNAIGLSALRLERIDGLNLHVRDVDLLDGTPILDIKPYVPYSDAFPDAASGWLDPQAADPRPGWTVTFTPEAEAQLAWLAPRTALPLRDRILSTLSLGPQPHPYRRIRRGRNGHAQLAVQDWRIDFDSAAQQIQVLGLRSGYDEKQLARSPRDAGDPILLHREYMNFWRSKGR